jgi:epoxyqueuosine reductase
MTVQEKYSQLIKTEALRLGFSKVGIAKAEFLEQEAPRLEQWLKNGFHGEMQYMENHFEKRLDPRKLVEGAQSVIVLAFNYFPINELESDTYKIARYAYGEDYHHVLKTKLKELLFFIRQNIGEVNGRAFTDSAPVMERVWAEKAGLGWQGKNTLLLQKSKGSYFLLSELIVDVSLAYDLPFKAEHCGSCTRCIDACPTKAILPNKILDAQKCISYLTIELQNEIPIEFRGKWEKWIFGCDICQEVCPWNQFSLPTAENLFQPSLDLKLMKPRDWQEITSDVFEKLFKKSPLKRTKIEGIKRNINFLK